MNPFASLEPEDRRRLLRSIGAGLGLQTFIETGTNHGLTPLALMNFFERIFTIELDDALFANAQRMFLDHPHVTCLHGDSTNVLPEVLAAFDGAALVWLDGHYSGPGTAHGIQSTPIREELAMLFADGRPHVILVDDARIFEGGPEHTLYAHYESYPSLEWVEKYARDHGYDYELADDIIRLMPS